MCRQSCTTPSFHSLPVIEGVPGVRAVHGMWMTEEEYTRSGWHSRGSYVNGRGVTEHIWIAPLGGLQEWSRVERQRREGRIVTAQARRQADEEWSDSVVAMIEARR